MRQENLREDIYYETDLGRFSISKYLFGHRRMATIDGYLRYIYSLSPVELSVNGELKYAPERSVIKLDPGTEIGLTMENDAPFYVVSLLKDEKQFIEDLKRTEQAHFQSLEDKASEDPRFFVQRDEWQAVSNQEPGYYIETERNKDAVVRAPGVLIAPAHSRFNPMAGNGWHLMYARGSIPFSIGGDYLFRVRSQEVLHMHKIIVEPYICIRGRLILSLDGEECCVNPGEVLITEPGDVHAMLRFDEIPYKGLTLQFPSIPGDKYSPEGERLVR